MRASPWPWLLAAACSSSSPPAAHPSAATPPAAAQSDASSPAATPLISPSNQTPVGDGGPAGDDVNRVMRKHAGSFRACYEKALSQRPRLVGKIMATFTIGADGAVTDVSAQGVDATLDACLEQQIRGLRFAPGAGPMNVTYPFVFEG